MPTNYKKRRVPHGPSKNELRSARNEKSELQKTRATTLSQRFPQVSRLELDLRLESPTGTLLDHVLSTVDAEEPLKLDVACPSTCSSGRFSLMETVETVVNSSGQTHEGMSLCIASSYADSRIPCSTKLYYKIKVHYKGE